MVRVTSGAATRAWACGCVGTPARGPPLSPLRKVLRARLRGRDPSTGWAGPCAIERTPSRVRRALSATPKMKTARTSRARSSHDLRKRTSDVQLAESITRICAGRAGMRRSKSAPTLLVWWRSSNGRGGQGNTHLSFRIDHDSSCVIEDPSRSRSRSSYPNVGPCACSCSHVNRQQPATANARRLR